MSIAMVRDAEFAVTGWFEVLGSGMVHPNVLNTSGIDTENMVDLLLVLVRIVSLCCCTRLTI